jgi:hypothetical protein
VHLHGVAAAAVAVIHGGAAGVRIRAAFGDAD